MELRKAALRVLIGSIVVSGLFAIGALVNGEFGRLQAQVLLSAIATSGASILGMACGAAWDRDRWRWLAGTGLGLALTALGITLVAVWVEPEPVETVMRWVASSWLVAVAVSHGSLLSLVRVDRVTEPIRGSAVVLGFLLSAGIVWIVWTDPPFSETAYYRALGVIGVLMSMGSLSLPVLSRLRSLPGPTGPPEEASDAPTTPWLLCPACGHRQRSRLGRVRCDDCGTTYRVEIEAGAAR